MRRHPFSNRTTKELEGMLARELHRSEPDPQRLAAIRDVLDRRAKRRQPLDPLHAVDRSVPYVPWRPIVEAVCRLHGLRAEDVMSRRRTRHVARARFATWAEIQRIAGAVPHAIAKQFGYDHTSVMHGLERHKELESLPLPAPKRAPYAGAPGAH